MERCSKCILPEVYPNITFDEKGECNYCNAHQKIQYQGTLKLKEDLEKYKNSGGKYDCLIPVSGGKDSIYVLYQLSKVYNMRVLAFNYDNCLTHSQAQENVQKITDSLGVDLVIKKNEKQKKYMITNLKAYLQKPAAAMIPMFCTGCRYGIIGNAFNLAKEHHIPIVVIGWSPIEDTPFKEAYLKGNGNSVALGILRNLVKNPSYFRLDNMTASIKDYFHNYSHVKDWNIILKMLYHGVRLVQFYDYALYNPDEIQEVVEKELNWITPDKKDSWQFDCKIKLLQNYFYEKEVGFTAFDDYLSKMVREGFLSRPEAIERLEHMKRNKSRKMNQLHEILKEINCEELQITQ